MSIRKQVIVPLVVIYLLVVSCGGLNVADRTPTPHPTPRCLCGHITPIPSPTARYILPTRIPED